MQPVLLETCFVNKFHRDLFDLNSERLLTYSQHLKYCINRKIKILSLNNNLLNFQCEFHVFPKFVKTAKVM